MGSSRVEQALNELDPGSRAVVDLSLGTDFSDENIATLIRVEPEEVARRRDRAIDALQQKLGGVSHDDVILELCAAMGVEPSRAMLEGGARNGSAGTAATVNGARDVAEPDASATETAQVPAEPEPGPTPTTGHHSEPEEVSARPDAEQGSITGVEQDTHLPAEPDPGDAAHAETEVTESSPPPQAAATGPSAERAERMPGELERPPEPEREPQAPETAVEAEPTAAERSEETREPGSRRRAGAILAALAAGAIVIVGIVALSSGGSGSEPVEPQAPATDQSAGPAPSEEPEASATLDALPDAPADGEAEVTLDGDRLTIELDGLPAPQGSYEAWLFTSVLDSRSLGTTDDGSGTISATLPDSADRFEYVDVSIQPSSDAQHSGQSIFRVPVADLVG